MSTVENTPVLIVGGGPTGLTLSALLSRFGVESLLVEADPETCDHPQAHVVNRRTVEIFRSIGIEDALHAQSDPMAQDVIRFVTSVAQEELACLEPRLDESRMAARLAASPSMGTSCPQDLVEPLLAARALEGPGRILFSTELTDYEHDDDGVTATVNQAGEIRQIRARWLVGCDGASSTTRTLAGIEMEGMPTLAYIVGIYCHVDLSPWMAGRPVMLYWTIDAEAPVTIIHMGHNRCSVQTAFSGGHVALDEFTPERCVEIVRRAVGADVDVEVRSVKPWALSAQTARSWRRGPVFLAGDAAHRFPPTGGYGLNTGVQDAHNLAWKLAAVLNGRAGASLLNSYEAERSPVAVSNTEFSVRNVMGFAKIMGPGAQMQGQRLAAGEVTLEALSAEIQEILDAEAGHFDSPGRELGFCYEDGALEPDGTSLPAVEDPDRDYVPCARPGARAPHLWLQRDGQRISTLDLYGDAFVLLAGTERASAWEQAARQVSPLVDPVIVGDTVADVEGNWRELYGVEDGAVLIRPDGHVAWRARHAVHDPGRALQDVLDRVLCNVPG